MDDAGIAGLETALESSPENTTLRLNGGTGFRIVNLFTEDHAAYTGARATVLLEDLKPERSYRGWINCGHSGRVSHPMRRRCCAQRSRVGSDLSFVAPGRRRRSP